MFPRQVKPADGSSEPGSISVANSTPSLTTAAEVPMSKDPPAKQDPAQEASKQDRVPASSSAATETEGLGSDNEPTDLEPPVSRQGPAENHRSKDLWEEAYAQLRKEEQELIDAYEKDLLALGSHMPVKAGVQALTDGVGGEDRAERLQKLANDKLDGIQKARLKVTIGGQEIVVEDQVRKLVHTILTFRDFIGDAISAEPHAALAWAGVIIILPVSIHRKNRLAPSDADVCRVAAIKSCYTS